MKLSKYMKLTRLSELQRYFQTHFTGFQHDNRQLFRRSCDSTW